MTIQWAVVWSVLRTLLVAGGPVGTLLIALGFPPVQVSTWLGIGLGVVGVLSVAVPGLVGAFSHTDSSKVATIKAMSPERANAAVDSLPVDAKSQIKLATMPDEVIVAAAAKLPDVAAVVVKHDAGDGVAAAAADPSLPKVVKEGT